MIVKDSASSIEGLPLQLIITAVVLAITVPIMFGGLNSYDQSKLETELMGEIQGFISDVQQIYLAGPGNSATMNFVVPNGALNSADYVIFGDGPQGNYSSVIRYRISGESEVPVVVASPNVPMMSEENAGLEVIPGTYSIIISCQSADADLNDDGFSPDNFVQLSLSSV